MDLRASTSISSSSSSPIRVLITSGVKMFHLPFLAAALDEHVVDFCLLIGLYPLPKIRWLTALLPPKSRLKILDRLQDIDDQRIHIYPFSEVLAQSSSSINKYILNLKIRNFFTSLVHKAFASKASSELVHFRPIIYHYRCSFGLSSLSVADHINAIKLCDHSIAHPAHIEYLLANNGSFPEERNLGNQEYKKIHFKYMDSDLVGADHIVVNSEFVKASLLRAGYSESSISVIELGVDQRIIDYSKNHYTDFQYSKKSRPSLLYAGAWIHRKGVCCLADTINLLEGKVKLRIAGSNNETITRYCNQNNLSLDHFKPLGYLSREMLAAEMIRAKIFVFPSLCEGYAKVIQEALVCGCFIIATHNSGFSLSGGLYGTIVSPNDKIDLSNAIQAAINNPRLFEYCDKNRQIALEMFSPRKYAEKIKLLYRDLSENRKCKRESK